MKALWKASFTITLSLCSCLKARARSGADWPTFGHDPQRTGWAFEESILTSENVSHLELKWRTPLKNEPKSLTALTAPW